MDKIRVGMIRADIHAGWYAPPLGPVDELAMLEHYPQCQYYFYYRHRQKFDPIPGFEITTIYDRWPLHQGITPSDKEDLDNAQIFRKVCLGKPEICDNLDAVSDDVDMVFIANCMGDADDHLELATPGLKKGVPTFVDKPYAYTLTDAHAIIDLATENDTAVMSSSLLRQNPMTEQFKSRFTEIAPVGEGFIKGVGNSQLGAIIHGLSLAQHVFGEGVEWVDCMGQMDQEIVRLHYPGTEEMPKGIEVIVMNSHLLGPNCGYQCVVYGQKGSIISPWINDYNFPLGGQVIVEKCKEMVRTRKPQIPYESMLELIETVEAARRSQETGKRVRLEDVRASRTGQFSDAPAR